MSTERSQAMSAPWTAKKLDVNHSMVHDAAGVTVVPRMITEPGTPSEHRAVLIAAAPDLLQLAKRYARECAECDGRGYILIAGEQFTQEASDRTREECDECADIREVIAKAEGRS